MLFEKKKLCRYKNLGITCFNLLMSRRGGSLSLRMSDLFVFQGLGTIFAIVPI